MEDEEKKENGNCRDFERGVCFRGNKCKFFHPADIPQPGSDGKLPICKDFQNKGCDRKSCKFLHINEDASYKSSSRASKGKDGKEACKDYMNGICKRSNCKFMHIPERSSYDGHKSLLYGKRRRDEFGRTDLEATLADENEMLKRKITDLQRQVIDLREMNDTLYDQNTRYRNQLRGLPTSTLSTDPYARTITYPPVAGSERSLYAPEKSAYDDYMKF